jgi:uncharacterized membrane protein
VSKNNNNRLLSIDSLRGIAVVLMVVQHLVSWSWQGPRSGELNSDYPIIMILVLLGGLAAPLFVVLSGMGVKILHDHTQESNSYQFKRKMVLRGGILILLGYLLNFLTPSWLGIQSWYILHLIGLGVLVSPWSTKLSIKKIILFSACIFLFNSWVHIVLEIPNSFSTGMMNAESRMNSNIPSGLYLVYVACFQGQFPIFPWMVLFLFGHILTLYLDEFKNMIKILMASVGVGLLCVLVSKFFDIIGVGMPEVLEELVRFQVPFFPLTLPLAMFLFSGVVACCILVKLIEENGFLKKANLMVTLGNFSLSILVFHILLFRELGFRLGLFRVFDGVESLVVSAFTCMFVFVVGYYFSKWNPSFSFEKLIRIFELRTK